MKKSLLAGLFVWVALSAARSVPPLATEIRIQMSPSPLENPLVWEYEPGEPNPHRRFWAIQKEITLEGLSTETTRSGKFGVRADRVTALFTGYLRRDDHWYEPPSRFPCTPVRGNSLFATREGVETGVTAAAKIYQEALEKSIDALHRTFKQIESKNADAALVVARNAFDVWKTAVVRENLSIASKEAQTTEWKWYQKQFKSECQNKKRAPILARTWNDLTLEPVLPEKPQEPLMRAPAKVWGGQLSVRVTLNAFGEDLVGQFLIDPSIEENLVSTAWLGRMGAPAGFLRSGSPQKRKIRWRGFEMESQSVLVDSAEIAGYPLSLDEFWPFETELFVPPKYRAVCCDGVLGRSFLRRFAVELNADYQAYVQFYARSGFYWFPKWISNAGKVFWIPVEETGEHIRSSCKDGDHGRNVAINWNLGHQESLKLPTFLKQTKPLGVSCAQSPTLKIFEPNRFSASRGASPSIEWGLHAAMVAPVVLDLSNGRIWLTERSIETRPLRNLTPFTLQFKLDTKGDRVLSLVKIGPEWKGFRPKLPRQIESLNGRDAGEIDSWELDALLGGGLATQKIKLGILDPVLKEQVYLEFDLPSVKKSDRASTGM